MYFFCYTHSFFSIPVVSKAEPKQGNENTLYPRVRIEPQPSRLQLEAVRTTAPRPHVFSCLKIKETRLAIKQQANVSQMHQVKHEVK